MTIREFDHSTDAEQLDACIIELQDYENGIDARIPTGDEVIGDYLPMMLKRCEKNAGQILVLEDGNEIAGYALVLTKVRSDDLIDGDYEYGVLTDLVVRHQFRGRGYGRDLLLAAEAHAKASGVRWLRLGVLASNVGARKLYASLGYEEFFIDLEKPLS